MKLGRQSGTWLKLGVPAFAAKVMAGEMAEELLLSGTACDACATA